MIYIFIGILIGVGISLLIFFLTKKLLDRHAKSSFDDLSRKSLSDLMPSLLDIAKRELGTVREEIGKDVEREKGHIKETLEKLEENIRHLEGERNRQFGNVAESIKLHGEIAERLREETGNLTKILSDNKLRGKWGERIAEDILRVAGFIEGVHYLKQTSGEAGTIPDFTILLPNNRLLHIDAKFPFANLQAYQTTNSAPEKKRYIQQFASDVRAKIKEVTSRAYINPDEGTLDFTVMFVPSEAVFSFMNQELVDVIDDGLGKGVIVSSPSSLYATARIIMESHRHFAYEKNVRDVMAIIHGFIENFHRFQDEFSEFDDYLKKMRQKYDTITETRYKKMGVQIRKIEQIEGAGDTP